MIKYTRRSVFRAGAAASAVLAIPYVARAATELVVTVAGGSFEAGWRKSVIAPFERANPGVTVRVVQGMTFQNAALMRAQKDDVRVDVFNMDEVAATLVAAEGLMHPLTTEAVPNLMDVYPDFRVDGNLYTKLYWVPAVLSYSNQISKPTPTNWDSLWEPRYKGRLAIPNLDITGGLLFFLALNKAKGGTIENTEPAFAALKSLKRSVVAFPTQHAQQAQMFAQGDIVIAPWLADRAISFAQSEKSLGWTIPKDGSTMTEGTMCIAKGTSKLDLAYKYVNLAISPEVQAATAKFANLSPVNAKAELDPETKAILPNGRDTIASIDRPDWRLVNKYYNGWLDRWNREIVTG